MGSLHAWASVYVICSIALSAKSYMIQGHKIKPRVCTKSGPLKGGTLDERMFKLLEIVIIFLIKILVIIALDIDSRWKEKNFPENSYPNLFLMWFWGQYLYFLCLWNKPKSNIKMSNMLDELKDRTKKI